MSKGGQLRALIKSDFALAGGMAEKSTRRQNWGRKMDFLQFVKCNIELEDEEGSEVSH